MVAIDDRSTDQTGAIMDEFAATHADRLRVLHIPQGGLPPGWLGKCNALHTAAAGTTADWLLFVDSDVKIARSRCRPSCRWRRGGSTTPSAS